MSTSLESKCRALVRTWRWTVKHCSFEDCAACTAASSCADELATLLPKPKRKKKREVIRYGPPPWTVLNKRQRAKMLANAGIEEAKPKLREVEEQ